MATVVRHPWLAYTRRGGAHGPVIVWDRARGTAGVTPPVVVPTSGRKLISPQSAATLTADLT